jgi:hypothetical protein
MSTPVTGAVQRARLVAAGLRVAELPQLRDVDTAADALAAARQAPWTRFAARARRLAAVLGDAPLADAPLADAALADAVLADAALGATA